MLVGAALMEWRRSSSSIHGLPSWSIAAETRCFRIGYAAAI
jgi:hypothetical protein